MFRRRKQLDGEAIAPARLKRRLGITSKTLRFLERSGFVERPTRASHYQFRDLLLFRAVASLRAANVSTRAIHRAIAHLRPWLSAERPISRISLDVANDDVVVREGDLFWEPASGQYALPLELRPLHSHIVAMKKRPTLKKSADAAHAHYLRGSGLEEDDVAEAKAAYEACLDGDCSHVNARINLGRLLHLEGKHREAEVIYRATSEPDAVLFFNLGVLLEDQDKAAAAISAYRDALVHDPGMADAHFNLALLLERAGEAQAAYRHLLAYRRLTLINHSAGN